MGRVQINIPAGGDFWGCLGDSFALTYGGTASGSGELQLDVGKEYLVIAVSLGSGPWQERAWEVYRVRGGELSVLISESIGQVKKMDVWIEGNLLKFFHNKNNCYYTLAVLEGG